MTRKGIVLALLILFAAIPIALALAVNNDPIAVAKGPEDFYACEREGVELNGSGSYDDDGWITEWNWYDSEGKLIGQGEQITLGKKFTENPGTYTVTLKVTDNGGATDTVGTTFRVKHNPRPQIEEIDWEREEDYYDDDDRKFLVFGDNFTVEVDLYEDNDHGVVVYEWDYPAEVFRKIGVRQTRNGEKEKATFEVISDGIGWKTSYEIGVTVSNACGEGGVRKYIELDIESSQCNQPPKAEIILPKRIYEGESFQARFSYTTGRERNESNDEVVDWYWELRNEQKEFLDDSSNEDPQFKIEDSGIYNVSLRITDRFGATGETSISFKVEEYENDPPVANASATKRTVFYGEPFELNGSCSWDPDEMVGGEEYSIKWYIWKDETYDEELCRSRNPVCNNVVLNRTGPHKIVLEVRDAGDRVEKGDDEIEILFNRNEIEITVIEPPEPVSIVTPMPALTPAATPTLVPIPKPTPTPTLEKIPAPTIPEKIWEIIESIIKALF